ncbi:MAG: hypothetical protein WA354_19915 [Terracidiphilus sp.]
MKFGNKDIAIQGQLIRIARLDGEKYTFPDDPEEVVASLRRCGTRVDLFTFLQKLPDTSPRYSYPFVMDNLAVLEVSTFDNWWNNQIRSYPRNRARQAQKKGVVLREIEFGDELVRGIREVYNETPIRQGKRFPHYGMTMERARQYAGTFLDRSIYVGAFLDEKMIGFIKLSMDESRTQACLVHILSMAQHKDKAPTNALIAEAVRTCAKNGVSYLIYENFNYGNKEDSLTHFKEVNGFQRLDVPRYYVPLTARGRIAFSYGLHRRIVDRIPEPIAEKFRDIRKAWYDRRYRVSAES